MSGKRIEEERQTNFRWSEKTCFSLVRPQGQLINWVKAPFGLGYHVISKCNCVIAKWRAEQLEAKGQSVEPALSLIAKDNESDSARQRVRNEALKSLVRLFW